MFLKNLLRSGMRILPGGIIQKTETELKCMYGALALIYDQLMAHVDYAGWVTFAEQAFTRYQVKPETVLDLACGTGGITSRLLAKGYQVTGVDISPDMLAVCADRNQQYLTTGKLALIAQDMRLVTLPRPVDAVVCFLDSLNYLASPADLQTVFQRIAQVLRPGGVLVADLHTEYKLATLVA
ncbi:MAG: class I SAM-dependent methyltransferase, partial [Heliobacteriaceae bacterium]|nr:class I SAM-dependent methyltransferase [Heliobacteriaceae bacterium]